MSSEKLSSATDAVLVHSAPLPSDTVKVRGVLLPSPAHGAATTKPTTSEHSNKNDTAGQDRGSEAVVGADSEDEVKRRASERAALVASTTQEVVAQSLAVGFQATNFGKAMEEMNRMLEHRHVVLNDDEEEALKAYINATTNAAATAAAQKLAATSTSGVSLAPGTAAAPLADGDNDEKKQEVASSPPPRPSWLPAEVVPKDGESFDKLLHCTNYCGVAANLMATGVRDACRFLAQEKLIDNYVVSAGGIEHDLRRLFPWHQYHVAAQPQPPQHESHSQDGATQSDDNVWVKIDNIRFRAGPCPSPVLPSSAMPTTTQSDDVQDASSAQGSLAEKTAAALRSVIDVRAMLASIEHYDSADARRAAAAAKSEAARARRLAARAAAQKTTAPPQQGEPPKEAIAAEATEAEGDAVAVSLPRPESFIPTCCFEHCATVIIAQMLASPRLNYFIPGDDDDRNPRCPCFVRPGDALPADCPPEATLNKTDAEESRVCFRPSAFWREFALRLAALHPVLPGLGESFTLTALLPEAAMQALHPDATHTAPPVATKSTSSAAESAAIDVASPYAGRRVRAAFEATAASVFSPNFADGDVTGLIDAAEALLGHRRSAVCDLIGDISDLNRTAMRAQRTGMVVLGGGVIKHHVCNANLMRNGADHSVFLNTGQEFDGSDAGARPDEAVSWGKIRLTARPVKVYAEATVTVPMLVAQTAAPHVRRRREALGF